VALQLGAVSRRFGAVQAVDGLSLTVARGETVALLGPFSRAFVPRRRTHPPPQDH
jgi:ABC-type branched-subunit amino acid transport system ATPase component